MILLSFFKFVENEMSDRYYLRLKDLGLLFLLMNVVYISVCILLKLVYDFSLISFVFGYIVNYLTSIENVMKHVEQLYNFNKRLLVKGFTYVDNNITEFINKRKEFIKSECDKFMNDDVEETKKERECEEDEIEVEKCSLSMDEVNAVENGEVNIVESENEGDLCNSLENSEIEEPLTKSVILNSMEEK